MIVLIFKMLRCMLVVRRWLFWWGLSWIVYNVSTLSGNIETLSWIGRITSFIMSLAFMVHDFYAELLYVRANKHKGPR